MALDPTFQKDMERYALGLRDTMPAGPAASVNTIGPQNAGEAGAMANVDVERTLNYFTRDREGLAQSRGFADWNATPPGVREQMWDNYSPSEFREGLTNRNRGWFARLMRAIARTLLGEKKRNPTTRSAALANA